jgi:hypothetical protein
MQFFCTRAEFQFRTLEVSTNVPFLSSVTKDWHKMLSLEWAQNREDACVSL